MILLRHIVAASSILLVLLSTPAVVKGMCHVDCVCSNSDGWRSRKNCASKDNSYGGGLNIDGDIFYSYSVCNWFGCNCEKCEAGTAYDEWDKTCQNPWELLPGCVEQVDGACPTGACCDYGTWKPERALEKCCVRWDDEEGGRTVDQQEFCVDTRRMMNEEEKKEDDGCADFNYVRSLSAAGKRKLLAEKYCTGADQNVREDIFEVLLSLTLSKYKNVDFSKAKEYIQNAGGIDQVLTCDLFNKSYGETDQLTLCEDKPQVVPASPKKGKKQKKTP